MKDDSLLAEANDILKWGSALERLLHSEDFKIYMEFEDFQHSQFMKAMLGISPQDENFGQKMAHAKGYVDSILKLRYNRQWYINRAMEMRNEIELRKAKQKTDSGKTELNQRGRKSQPPGYTARQS